MCLVALGWISIKQHNANTVTVLAHLVCRLNALERTYLDNIWQMTHCLARQMLPAALRPRLRAKSIGDVEAGDVQAHLTSSDLFRLARQVDEQYVGVNAARFHAHAAILMERKVLTQRRANLTCSTTLCYL